LTGCFRSASLPATGVGVHGVDADGQPAKNEAAAEAESRLEQLDVEQFFGKTPAASTKTFHKLGKEQRGGINTPRAQKE